MGGSRKQIRRKHVNGINCEQEFGPVAGPPGYRDSSSCLTTPTEPFPEFARVQPFHAFSTQGLHWHLLFPLLKYEPSPFCPLLDFWCPDSIFTERPLREPVWVPEWKVEPMRILFQSPLQHFLVLFTQERIRPFWAAPDLFAALHPGEAQPAPTRQLSGKLTKQSLLKAQMNCVLGIFFFFFSYQLF